jgi:hypothetical protein
VFPLGYVDHSKPGFGLDIKKNKKIEIKNYPLRGLRQPDGISAFTVNGKTFVLTANEGSPVNDYKAWTDVTTPMMLAQNGRKTMERYPKKLRRKSRRLLRKKISMKIRAITVSQSRLRKNHNTLNNKQVRMKLRKSKNLKLRKIKQQRSRRKRTIAATRQIRQRSRNLLVKLRAKPRIMITIMTGNLVKKREKISLGNN